METQDLERIRFVTQHFHDLQGLRYLVPIGLMVLSGGTALARGWLSVLLQAGLFCGGCLLMLGAKRYYRSAYGEVERAVAQPVAVRSYLSVLGYAGPPQVPSTIPIVPRFLLVSWLAVSVFVVFQILFWPPWVWVDSHFIWTGSSSAAIAVLTQSIYALCGSFFLGLWWWRKSPLARSYDLGIGILLAGFSVLAPWLVPEATNLRVVLRLGLPVGFLPPDLQENLVPIVADLRMALLLCGAALIAVGCLDHWQLVRVLGRPASASGEEE